VAARQLEFTVSSYNLKSPGLGESFLDEFVRTVDLIQSFPAAWPVYSGIVRRCRLRKFPYTILYEHVENSLVVIAIPHLHSNPENWLAED
jgi:toxin ParE2